VGVVIASANASTCGPVAALFPFDTEEQAVALANDTQYGLAGGIWTRDLQRGLRMARAGLDEHQVRRWTSWRRWTLLAMLAHALLAVLAATEHIHAPAPAGLIALTCNGIRRLFTIYIIEPQRARACPNAWSRWRRLHQHRARTSHNQRQEAAQASV
jgi:hypothetical protein